MARAAPVIWVSGRATERAAIVARMHPITSASNAAPNTEC